MSLKQLEIDHLIALWQEAENCAAMLSARTLRLADTYGAKLPGDGDSTFAEHAEGYASQYLLAVETSFSLDRDAASIRREMDEKFVEVLQHVREFEQSIKERTREEKARSARIETDRVGGENQGY